MSRMKNLYSDIFDCTETLPLINIPSPILLDMLSKKENRTEEEEEKYQNLVKSVPPLKLSVKSNDIDWEQIREDLLQQQPVFTVLSAVMPRHSAVSVVRNVTDGLYPIRCSSIYKDKADEEVK